MHTGKQVLTLLHLGRHLCLLFYTAIASQLSAMLPPGYRSTFTFNRQLLGQGRSSVQRARQRVVFGFQQSHSLIPQGRAGPVVVRVLSVFHGDRDWKGWPQVARLELAAKATLGAIFGQGLHAW